MANAIPIILAVASTAASVYSSVQSGRSEDKAAKKASRQAAYSASLKAEDERKKRERILATQRARYGASGVTMEGSPLLVQMESLAESEEQLRRIRETGYLQADLYEEQGEEAKRSGYVNAAGAAVRGASDVYSYGNKLNWWS